MYLQLFGRRAVWRDVGDVKGHGGNIKNGLYIVEILSNKNPPKLSLVILKYRINAINGIASRFNKWIPIARPIRYEIKTINFTWICNFF